MKNNLTSKSKFLSLILRHEPQAGGITLDKNGWANISEITKNNSNITRNEIILIVDQNDKKRFELSFDLKKIRAVQGHSINNIDVELNPIIPPPILYHGTSQKYLSSILKLGIQKQNRNHVHLSDNFETAKTTGKRHGDRTLILEIRALDMHNDLFIFFKAKNGVYLTDNVPPTYIHKIVYI